MSAPQTVLRQRRTPVAAFAVVAVLAVAGCGGGGGGKSSAKKSAPSKPAAATVAVRSTKLGRILVDGRGRTLYLFEKDKNGKSTCFGACAGAWPPFTTSGKPRPGSGASAAMLGTTPRKGGAAEVTYNRHPLYYYAGDTGPGETKGENLEQFGAEWYVLSAKGDKVEPPGS